MSRRASLITAARTGLFTRSAGLPMALRGSLWGMVREPHAGAWQRGIGVEPMAGLTAFSAVYACAARIANDIAKLGLQLNVGGTGGTRQPAPDASPYWTALRRPNGYQNSIQLLVYWLLSKLLYGNAYLLKRRDDARGLVTALYPLDPRRVTPMVTPGGDVYYSLGGDDLSLVPTGAVVPAREIVHDRHLTLWHPLIGVSPIHACGIAATQGLRIQSNSANFFANMSRPSGMLTAPGTISETTAERLKKEWESNYSGLQIGRLAVLGDGLDYKPMTIPADDAQLIEQLKWTVEDVARAFGVPLHKIGAGPEPTMGTTEARETQYYSGTLQIYIECIESCLSLGLGVPAGYEVELDLDGLLRMDSATQIDLLVKAVGGGVMKPDEARARRNLLPVAGGDAVYLQQQNYSLAALAKRDAREDPFATGGGKAEPAAPPAAEPAVAADDDEAKQAAVIAKAVRAVLEQGGVSLPLERQAPAQPDALPLERFADELEAWLATEPEVACG